MRKHLHLAATLLLTTAMAHAQITNPDNLVAHPPTNPAQHQTFPTNDNLQWLWSFTKPTPNGRADDLRLDARFQSLLARDFKQPQAMWGEQQPLDEVIPLFLTQHGTITAEDNRYITIDGCVPSFCPAHGMLWIDLGTTHPLVVFAGVNWTSENHTTDESTANYNLWLFSNRLLDPNALPLALTASLAHWDARLATAHRLVPHIAQAILVEPSGAPHELDPQLVGANTIAPQPDTTTPSSNDTNN